jgi:hypothetical protein
MPWLHSTSFGILPGTMFPIDPFDKSFNKRGSTVPYLRGLIEELT